jgi:L-threonylcarbamoyladenylate synthase
VSVSSAIVPADASAIARAGALLREGRLVGLPTETVYGLAGDATSDSAVAAIFAAKDRPRFNPLIVHYAQAHDVEADAVMTPLGRRLAQAFWPGPLTLVLARAPGCHVSLLCSAGLDTVAVRVPGHPVARAVVAAAGRPLAAPSANRAERVSPTRAEHVTQELGASVALVLDAGPCAIGVESTVIDATGERATLLRSGGLAVEDMEALIGPLATIEEAAGPQRAPGRLGRHYAPGVALRLDATRVTAHEALLAFGPDVPAGAQTTLNLSPDGDVTEAAAHLFAMLRALDDPRHAAIAVMPIPERGLGRAINDRLRRAARRA